MSTLPEVDSADLFQYLLRLGDDRLVLGHRTSEWAGHAPALEEDIALANIALDLLGQATPLLKLAGVLEGKGRSEDDLAFLRDTIHFRNLQLVELPNGDFAHTVLRLFLFSVFSVLQCDQLSRARHEELAGIAGKALKEARYHVRFAGEWVIRLGDGTHESRTRMNEALQALWGYTPEMFVVDEVDERLLSAGLGVNLPALKNEWEKVVSATLTEATLTIPSQKLYISTASRGGAHTEHLGHMLAEMQFLQRAYPGATW